MELTQGLNPPQRCSCGSWTGAVGNFPTRCMTCITQGFSSFPYDEKKTWRVEQSGRPKWAREV